MRALPFVAALLLVAPFPALAATLRPLGTLDAQVVRVGDLFADAGPGAERILGPAPAPGSRIVVEAAQLAAIARQFGVDWRPMSPSDRAVLDRPGRALPRDVVLGALRAALAGVGAGDDLEIDLSGFAAPMVPPGVTVDATIEQLDWDAGSGRFTGLLGLTAEGMTMQRLRVSGAAQEMIAAPVAVRRLNPGSIVLAEDIRIARVRAGQARGEIIRNAADVVGMTLRRQASAGLPLLVADLTRTPMVQKGSHVTMRLQTPGLTLAAIGQALEAGSQGEHIRVLNATSRAVVEAEIVGPDEVRVLPGTQPLFPANNRTALLGNGFGGTP